MDNAIMILSEEKQRLESVAAIAREKMLQVSAPALVQRPQQNPLTGEEVMVSYIDLDRFTPEQREQFAIQAKWSKEQAARLDVFETFIMGHVPPAVVQSYNQYVTPLGEYNDVMISCNSIELDEKGNFSRYSIKVGGVSVDSPETMTFAEYKHLYTSALGEILTSCLGNGLTQEEARKQLQSACTAVYLPPENKASITL